jgi:importin subunit beta-1
MSVFEISGVTVGLTRSFLLPQQSPRTQTSKSSDLAIRTAAEGALLQAEQSNLPQFVLALAQELAAENRDTHVRQLAGLHLKNLIAAKGDALRDEKAARWKGIDPQARDPIKHLLLQTLSTSLDGTARHTSAQACAEIAAVELPVGDWPQFLPTLVHSVNSNTSPESLVNALECLGYTCDALQAHDATIDQNSTNQMLTAIVNGIRADRPDAVRLAAAIALRNSLMFASGNFDNEMERNMIMQTICEATQSTNVDVRAAAFECIVNIAYLYYDKLSAYMQALFQLTFASIKTDNEKVALQAIEFWCTICEEEINLMDEITDALEQGLQPERTCYHYVVGALEHLVPLLTEQMAKQEEAEDFDEDAWNISMAGATCLSLVAQVVEDKIVPVVMPFVQANIHSENWRLREAATMCFGSILEGPSSEVIGPYVQQSVPLLLAALADKNPLVQDTTAWTLSKICEVHSNAIPADNFPLLVNGLNSTLLSAPPRVASQSCNALIHLADAFPKDAINTNALSQYIPTLFQTLLQTTERSGWDEHYLRVRAFEAINSLIIHSAVDCKPILVQLLPAVVEKLARSFNLPVVTNEDKEHKEGLQGLLCGLIQTLCIKLDKESLQPYADAIMTNTLQVLQTKNTTAHEESLLATAALADQIGNVFEKYMPHLHPFLLACLKNFEAYQVCSVAVGLVSDISRALGSALLPYCDEIVTVLLQMLQNPTLHRSVKPPVLGVFGDLAFAIGGNFEKYLQVTLMMLLQASSTVAPEDDDEMIDYVNVLREGILEAYTGIVQGLKDSNRAEILMPYVESIMGFLEFVNNDENIDVAVINKAVGLIG